MKARKNSWALVVGQNIEMVKQYSFLAHRGVEFKGRWMNRCRRLSVEPRNNFGSNY